jgi:hypothetical protein
VAFFVNRFPVVSEPFIANAAAGLLAAGHSVDIYALQGIADGARQPSVTAQRLDSRAFAPRHPASFSRRLGGAPRAASPRSTPGRTGGAPSACARWTRRLRSARARMTCCTAISARWPSRCSATAAPG